MDPRAHHRLARKIHKLKGAQLEKAINMIQAGIGDTPPCQNQTGDTEFEIAALPLSLITSLYNTFVGPTPRSSKRPKLAGGDSG